MSSQRILLAGGLLLFILSAAYGAFYDSFMVFKLQRAIAYNLDMALNMAAKGDIAMAGAFAEQFARDSFVREVAGRIPFHLALAGAMTAVALWINSRLETSERVKRIMALMIVTGGLLLVLGDFVQLGAAQTSGRYLVLVGYGWMILGLTGYLVYSLLHVWLTDPEGRPKRG